jgi:Zinc-finger associated domain (zf-AD).
MFVGDNLPTQICVLCAQKVDGFYNFKLQCERSDAALRHYLKDQNFSAQLLKVIMFQQVELYIE